LALQDAQRGRILALLVFSNIFLIFYVFYSKSKIENIRLQFDQLVRNLGSDGIEKSLEVVADIEPVMILIPAYNEEANLRELLPKIPKQLDSIAVGVLVVDDGSDDDTFHVADNIENVFVVKNPINRGGGAALRLGYDILKKAGARICVTMDADGQHQSEEIEKLVLPIIRDEYDVVIGSRMLGGREKDSLFRFIGVHTFGRVVSLLLGKKITDPSSGFRAFRMDAVASIDLYEDQYHTSELIIEAIKKGMRIGEVPITILKRKHGKSKKGSDWRYGLYFARTIVRTWWRR
jgi:glycosyltransferase involved in cell wall biosynthesis